jgi:hypothetical protein
LVGHVEDRVSPAVDVKVGDRTFRVETDMFLSAERWSAPDFEDVVLRSVALAAFSSRANAHPLRWLKGRLDYRSVGDRWR